MRHTHPPHARRSCGHLYCRKCAERDFGRALTCPLCDADVSDDGGVSELDCTRASAMATAAFALAVTQPEEAARVLQEAAALARAQTALYGACARGGVELPGR